MRLGRWSKMAPQGAILTLRQRRAGHDKPSGRDPARRAGWLGPGSVGPQTMGASHPVPAAGQHALEG